MSHRGTQTLANGWRIDVLGDGLRWLGFGAVYGPDGTPLRSGALPMIPEVRTPDGIEVVGWGWGDVVPVAGGFDLTVHPEVRETGMMEWMLHASRHRYRVHDWTSGVQRRDDCRLICEVRPVRRHVGHREVEGFAYRYRWQSPDLAIYRLLDRGSWEPGGRAVGNELWNRSAFLPPEAAITDRDQRLSSEWHLPGIRNPDIFQFLPLQTGMQGFTTTRHASGMLFTWANEVAHVRTLLEKPRGRDCILHLHEQCGDLATTFDAAPIEVLFVPGALDRTQAINCTGDMRDLVSESLHRQAGLRRERAEPYGVVEEWTLPDFASYTHEAVPALTGLGCRWLYVPSEFMNNMNTWGLSNMCCVVDQQVSDAVGEQALADFCAAAAAGGAKVEMWGNTAYSTLTYVDAISGGSTRTGTFTRLPRESGVLAQIHDGFWVRNQSGAIDADHYAPVFCVTNLRDQRVNDYWDSRWNHLRERTGVAGIFLDSSFNLSSDKFHWAGQADGSGGATADQAHLLGSTRPEHEPPRAILSQYRAHLALVGRMQRAGFRYSGEDLGVFGINRAGPSVMTRLGNMHLWEDSYCVFDQRAIRAAGMDPEPIFFAGLAYRMIWQLYWDPTRKEASWWMPSARDPSDRPSASQAALLNAFNAVSKDMVIRELVADGAAVLWKNGGQRVLWTLAKVRLHGHPVQDVLDRCDISAGEMGPSRVLTWAGDAVSIRPAHALQSEAR